MAKALEIASSTEFALYFLCYVYRNTVTPCDAEHSVRDINTASDRYNTNRM